MDYRTLGNTDLQVSVLGFGASPLGGVFGPVDAAESARTVHMALDMGINFFDVSPYYGLTKAEAALGQALRGISRQRYILATKVGRYGDQDFDFSAERITTGIEESLSRLNTDYIDLIQCHDIEFGSLDQVIQETIPALRRIQEQGKVRHIGITGLPLKIFPYVLDRVNVDTILSYCHYCLNDTALEDVIPYLQQKQVGIINASPLAMGLLSENALPSWHPAPASIRSVCRQAIDYCRQKGADISHLALQFSLGNPAIASTLVGMANTEILQKNMRAFQEPINETLLHEVLAILAPIHNMSWSSGRLENN